jgi:hypothetical protein
MPYPVALFWWLQEISWNILLIRQLMFLCPVSDCIEVPTLMDGIEVDERFWTLAWRLIPDLAKDADINSTHQLLAQDVEAVRWLYVNRVYYKQIIQQYLLTWCFTIFASFENGPRPSSL